MRKQLVAVVAVLVVVSGFLMAADWPGFLGADRNGVSTETGLAKSWPEGGPKELWKFDLGTGFGPAAIEGGKVYILDRVENKQEVLRCIDLAGGKEEWSCAYDAPPAGKMDYPGSRPTPSIDDKYVFTVGTYGRFTCVSKETHKLVWSKNLSEFGSKMPIWGYSQSPLLYKGMVIVAPESADIGVMALDKATGDVKWKSKPVGAMAYGSPVLAKIGGVDQIVILNNSGGSAGISASDGSIAWTYDGWKCKVAVVPSATIIGDGRIFFTGGYNAGSAMIKVVDVGEGKFEAKELWKSKKVGSHVQNGVFWKDHLYVNSDNTAKGLVCLDLDGNILWETGNKPGFDKGNLIIADGMIYIMGGSGGTLRLVEANPEAYKEVSSAKVLKGEMVWSPMALSDGKLVVRDQNQMKCLDVSAAK